MRPDDLVDYATREETRREHLAVLRDFYGYKMFTGRGSRDLKAWLERTAETAQSNEDLARRFVEQCRATQTILPGITVIERLCADALVAAERRIDARIADRLDDQMCSRLDALLTETADGSVTRFVWLRQFEVGQNSADMNKLLDRLEFLQDIAVDRTVLSGVPPTASRASDGKGNGILQVICGIFQATVDLPSSRSALWNGVVPLPTQWSRPMIVLSGKRGARQNASAMLGRRTPRQP